MTRPTTIKFGKMRVKLGDGASPEVFDFPCGFTTKAFNRGKSLNEIAVPDCDDPDAPAWLERDVASLNWSITGQGVLAWEAITAWDAFMNSTNTKNVLIELEFPNETIVYSGAAHLETMEIGADLGQRVTLNVSMQGDGELLRDPTAS